MSGQIPREFIDDLLARVDIVDLIDSHVPLKKAGSNYIARCPFHNEKTPSFTANRKKQFYHCFGCGAGGDAIRFLMEYNHLDFLEAIEDLAGFVGVSVPRVKSPTPQKIQESNHIYETLTQANQYFQQQLRHNKGDNKAANYLKNRGVSGETAKKFALGYAPDEWRALSVRLNKKFLDQAGLLVTQENGNSYDRFRDRLIFPIRDKRNRTIGFGGRVLDDSLPKYINSPETSVFSKGREIYGLYELLQNDGKPEHILIVEGYMDVVVLAQHGFQFAVATLGTATSKAHLELLFRFCNDLVFCFDGDAAGRKAAWKAMETAFPCLSGRRQIRFITLPPEHDPDSLIREDKQRFTKAVEEAETLTDFFFLNLKQSLNFDSINGKAQVLEEGKGFIESMPNGYAKDMMLNQLQEIIGPIELEISKKQSTLKKTKHTPLRAVIALLLQNPEFSETVDEINPDWEKMSFPEEAKQGISLLKHILNTIEKTQPKNPAILAQSYQGTKWENTIQTLANYAVSPLNDTHFDEKAEFIATLERVLENGKKNYFNNLLKSKIQTRKRE